MVYTRMVSLIVILVLILVVASVVVSMGYADPLINYFKKETTYEILDNFSVMAGTLPNGPGTSNDELMIKYLGLANSVEEAQALCSSDSNCRAFVWHKPDYCCGWANMCYGMYLEPMAGVKDGGTITGIKK